MKTVKQLLEIKGHEVASISPDKSVFESMQLMAARNIGALLVLEAGGSCRHSDREGLLSQDVYTEQVREGHICNGNYDTSVAYVSGSDKRGLHGADHREEGAPLAGGRK